VASEPSNWACAVCGEEFVHETPLPPGRIWICVECTHNDYCPDRGDDELSRVRAELAALRAEVERLRGALGEIAGREGVQVLESEIEAELARLAERAGRSKEAVRAQMAKDGDLSGLAARIREADAEGRERITVALAHVVARGHQAPVDTLAGGRDPAASQCAQRALERESSSDG